jgi:hypothetical protein
LATTAAEPTLDALSLSPLEHELLEAELADFAAVLPDPAARARYAELAAAVQQGEIPASLVAPLETMLDLVLQTQRVRRRHGAEADTALQDLLARTPRGRALRRGAHDVNKSLSALSGQVLESLRFSVTPGGQRLVVTTDECQVALTIDRAGVHLERLEL